MIFNYLGLGVKLIYPLLSRTILGGYALARIPLWWAGALWEELRWEGCGVPLDWAPWGLGEASESKPRANPDHGTKSIQNYLEVPWSGKRKLWWSGICIV